MKRTKHAKVLIMLCMAALLLFILPAAETVRAAEYEPLEVELLYTHRYTTNDGSEDSLFHYVIEPEEDAPLPKEADENGVFSYDGVSGSGEKSGDKTVYLNTDVLTFTFSKPGVYSYELSADLDIDNSKENVERYNFEKRTFNIHFYIVNAPDGGMKLEMLTAEDDQDVKPNEVILDPSYEGPVETTTESTTVATTEGSKKTTKSSRRPKTYDPNDALPYILMMLGAAAAGTVIYVNRRKKGSEDDA